jgi:hypothetical protein
VGVEDFINADVALGTVHAGEAGQQAFVSMIFFAISIAELAVDDFWDFCGIFIGQCGFAREQSWA